MDFYWLYDLSTQNLFVVVVVFFICIAVAGLFLFRRSLGHLNAYLREQNEHVGFYMNVIGLFYGITLALVTVSAWENYSDTASAVTEESACLATLYRNVDSYPDSFRTILQNDLKNYTRYVIDTAWPLQQKGILPAGGVSIMDHFRKNLYTYRPSDLREQVLFSQTLESTDHFMKARRVRIDAVNGGLPSMLWWVIIIGAVITIAMTWFYYMDSLRMQVIFNTVIGTLLGCMIFLLIALDNPFRGELSVSPESFEVIYKQIMR